METEQTISVKQHSQPGEIYAIPVKENYLLYAPLISYVSLVNKAAMAEIRKSLTSGSYKIPQSIKSIAKQLCGPCPDLPQPKQGDITSPLFLGLVTTRNCNMGCIYCDFAAPKSSGLVMSISIAKKAIDFYFSVLTANHHTQANIHFFGGEPFFSPEIVDFAVNYGRVKSHKSGIEVKYDVITNGFFDSNRASWVGETFDNVVLSLDGPEEIQNRNRPGLKGKKLFNQIYDNAKVFSRSPTNFIIRSCITDDTVERIPEIAGWIAQEFTPTTWCIEPLTSDSSLRVNKLRPPDPWKFAQNYAKASDFLKAFGIRIVNSTVELGNPQVSCCPVGKDAMIVSPDGYIDACYLLEKDWLAMGMNMRFGKIYTDKNHDDAIRIDMDALEVVRELNVYNRSLCQDCFCRYSCAGGCHVNHPTSAFPGSFDELCIYTRLITIYKLLSALGQNQLAEAWLASRKHMKASALRVSDRLMTSREAKWQS